MRSNVQDERRTHIPQVPVVLGNHSFCIQPDDSGREKEFSSRRRSRPDRSSRYVSVSNLFVNFSQTIYDSNFRPILCVIHIEKFSTSFRKWLLQTARFSKQCDKHIQDQECQFCQQQLIQSMFLWIIVNQSNAFTSFVIKLCSKKERIISQKADLDLVIILHEQVFLA